MALCILTMTFASTGARAANQEAYSATLVDFEGDVQVQKPAKVVWLPARKYMGIEEGDRIRTGPKAYVEILMDEGSLLRLEEGSEITLKELSADFETKRIFSTAARPKPEE